MPQLQSVIKLNQHFQITIPALIRKKYNLEQGDLIEASDTAKGILLKPKMLLDKLPEVELSKKGEKMLKESFEDFKAGRYKQFTSPEDLIKDLNS